MMKINYKYPCSLCAILHRCFFPRTFDFHWASFLGLFFTDSRRAGLTKPCSSGPGTLEKIEVRIVKQTVSKFYNEMTVKIAE